MKLNTVNMFLIIATFAIILFFPGVSSAQEVPDCLSCHEDVRHGQQNNTFCINCHINYEVSGVEHVDENISNIIPYVHGAFDWENNNQISGDIPVDESCPACHVSIHSMISARDAPEMFRKCEDCHVPGGIGPSEGSSGWDLRTDIESLIPKIYAHYNGSGIMNVKDQSGAVNGTSISTCFDYNVNTGEGTCHGVGETFSGNAGGYFSHVNDTEISRVSGLYNNPSDPYQYDVIVDTMPDTSDCMFCHYQENESIRFAWGGAVQPVSEIHLNDTANMDCWQCHTKNGKEPVSFHSDTMGEEEEKGTLLWVTIIGAISILAVGSAVYYFFVLKKK
ncbi:MAG: hypothetical protein SCH39_13290 [Methanosarcinales archaeon]|nr:hypothetical protein [ANME-2 cluster archaeon]MDF1532744.1 hypothetical protein [ANME-2 cluster archaeon]MDW7777294.1 hypothetical protein [Methanosarcinales archaeon]